MRGVSIPDSFPPPRDWMASPPVASDLRACEDVMRLVSVSEYRSVIGEESNDSLLVS